jgi:trans-2,3-dihydro-3-hydroxyanthranilate isomerase
MSCQHCLALFVEVTLTLSGVVMQRRFHTLDVFTQERFAGNPLAVVEDADGLEAPRMQAIAREFNFPETVFFLPASDPAHAARLRIFTPTTELPFAGHPTVGSAALLGLLRDSKAPQALVLEEQIGVIRCHVAPQGEETAHARFELPALPRKLAWEPDMAAVAAALRITPADIDAAGFQLAKWTAGVDMFMVPVAGRGVLSSVRPDVSRWEDAFGTAGPRAVYVFCPQGAPPAKSFRARMFAPLLGVPEDPATGAAAAAFAGALAEHGGLRPGAHEIVIEQGQDMGRPSVIHLEMRLDGTGLTDCAIAGHAVIVMQGTLRA